MAFRIWPCRPYPRGPSAETWGRRVGFSCRTSVRQASCHIGPISLNQAQSERSAARLAHQSGGLGVPSSNLGAPTIKIKDLATDALPSKSRWEAFGKHAK